jgi:hypothetical protein
VVVGTDIGTAWLVVIRRPFVVMRMAEAETLDDLDTPIIAFASPSLCNLLATTRYAPHDPARNTLMDWTADVGH